MPLYDHIEITASPTSFYADIRLAKSTRSPNTPQRPPRPRAPTPKAPDPMTDLKETRLFAAEELTDAIRSITSSDPAADQKARILLAVDAITEHIAAAIAARHPNPEGTQSHGET